MLLQEQNLDLLVLSEHVLGTGVPLVPGFSLWHGDWSRSPAFLSGSESKQEVEELLRKPPTWLTLQVPA